MGERKPKDYMELGKEKTVAPPKEKTQISKKEAGETKEFERPLAKTPAAKKTVPKKRSSRYLEKRKLVDKKREYPLAEAVKLVKQLSISGFEGGVEAHIQLKLGKKGEEEQLRGKVNFPSGLVKTQKTVVVSPEIIKEIEQGKLNFDILLARPDDLPTLAKVAKILGPKGKMPSVKSHTVVADPKKTLKEIEKGLTFWKADSQGVVHLLVGKISWSEEKILENIKVFFQTLPKNKILSFHLAPTIGPSVKVSLNSI